MGVVLAPLAHGRGVVLASFSMGIEASSVGHCDGCGFSCVVHVSDWLVGPSAMGTNQTRFAFAYDIGGRI